MQKEYDQREQQLLSISGEILSEIWNKRVNFIKKDYEINHEKYDKDIVKKIEKLLLQWENLYENQTEALSYMIISPLGSGVITKSYEFQIALFNQQLYLEENPLCFYWTPEFIYKDVEADMALYQKEASKKIIRLRKDEINEIRREYVRCHANLGMFYMDKIIKQMIGKEIWKRIAAKDIIVLYGNYMERMVEIGVVTATAK